MAFKLTARTFNVAQILSVIGLMTAKWICDLNITHFTQTTYELKLLYFVANGSLNGKRRKQFIAITDSKYHL